MCWDGIILDCSGLATHMSYEYWHCNGTPLQSISQQPAISTSSVLWFSFHCWFLLDYLQFPQQTVFEDNQRFLTIYPGATEICMFYQLIFCRFDSGTKHFLINAQLSQLMSCEALSNWRHAFKGKQLNWNDWNVDKTCSSHWNQPGEIVKLLSSLLSSVTGKSDRHEMHSKG